MARIRCWLILGTLLLCVAIAGSATEFEYLASGGGPSFGAFMPDLVEINDFLSGGGFAPFEGNLLLIGGTGGVAFAPGPTLSGGGWGAWATSTQAGLEAEYGVGLGGFELGYGVVGSENTVATIGLMMGMGGGDLTLTGNPVDPVPVPLGIIPEPTAEHVYNSIFLVLAPYADIQVNLLDFVGIRIRVGYLWSPLAYEWHDAGLPDAPHLALDGLYVHATVVFGSIFEMDDDEELAGEL